MIDKVFIENYKSIEKMDVELGRVNVFIGANGSGKSNVLEAIAFGAAAANQKLDSEYLLNRGIRVTDSKLMRNAFDIENTNQPINISFYKEGEEYKFTIVNNNEEYSEWKIEGDAGLYESVKAELKPGKNDKALWTALNAYGRRFKLSKKLKDFIIYSPENNELRKFEADSHVQPLGKFGAGLFRLLKTMDEKEISEIKNNLRMIDWFEDFDINEELLSSERRIQLKDRFLDETINFFDQKSANEGFLFLLFYLSVLTSKYTPSFFAVDNIDNALNPKLCTDLIRAFVKLSKSHEKQVLLTTHNPAVLDGLNLNDENQRLYVVHRNIQGATKIKRVDSTMYNANSDVRLSEAFVRGYIGGLNPNMVKW